jgi:hypothetical protein
MRFHKAKTLVISSISGVAMLAAGPLASAQTCFTAFGGSVHYQFAISPASMKQPGTKNVAGVVFGALAPCAGLTHWPVVGTVTSNEKIVVLGYRAMTVDASGCGAVDQIASLNPGNLNGPLQLHNDRNNFSNTSTLTAGPCVAVPLLVAEAATSEQARKDHAGNSAL